MQALSSKAAIATQPKAIAPKARTVVAPVVSCAALENKLAKAAAAAALAAVISVTGVEAAKADVAGLTPCSESKAFAKRKKQEIKGLQKRLKQYEADSAPALALNATIAQTEARFEKYASQGLLCGTDGLPHLIADPGLALRYGHAGDVLLPTVGFIYFAGWLGYAGSKYLQTTQSKEKEIIIDVPLAFNLLWAGLAWPVRALADYRTGQLLEDDSKITVSPR